MFLRRFHQSFLRWSRVAAVVSAIGSATAALAADPAATTLPLGGDVSLRALLAASDWGHGGDPGFRLTERKMLRLRTWCPEAALEYGYRRHAYDSWYLTDRYAFTGGKLVPASAAPSETHNVRTAQGIRLTLTWYPDRLFFPDQSREYDRKQLAWGKLRRERWKDVQKLYQKRAELLSRRTAEMTAAESLKNELDVQEITALLDVRTNSYFSGRQPPISGPDTNGE